MRQITITNLLLEGTQIVPCLELLQPVVQQTLVNAEAFTLLHLQQIVDKVDGCALGRDEHNYKITPSYKNGSLLPSLEISFHGCAGYMNAAF